jgi:energy-coupling factor transporter ATP-binding protein EcfA2
MDAARLDRVRYRYPGAADDALRGLSLRLAHGEVVLVAGPSGSGKSTLLRVLSGLCPHFHGGRFAGVALVGGRDTRRVPPAEICVRAGIVFQDPESGTVARTVEREVAFPLENAAVEPAAISGRIDEALALVGASHLRARDLPELSGGELQRVALAAALAARPALLLLDEPTSQLDPGGADALAALLRRLADEQGVTVVVADHRTARVEPVADRALVMRDGAIVPGAMPELPGPEPLDEPRPPGRPLASLHGIVAGYGDGPAVLAKAELELPAGTVTVLAGPNGCGKTTLARVLAGLHPARGGRVVLADRDVTHQPAETRLPALGYVGQDPGRYLLHEEVQREVGFALELAGAGEQERDARVAETMAAVGLDGLAERHPRDLSGGERERTAIASILVARPGVLVLDEPTRGMDNAARARLRDLLRRHAGEGGAALVVTHDRELAAAVGDRRLELDRGRVRAWAEVA